jgi:hypothetical protein
LDSRRGISPSEYYYRLDSSFAGANNNTAQSLLGVGITLAASTQYEFEIYAVLLKIAGTNLHTMSTLFGGTATLNNILTTTICTGLSNTTEANTLPITANATAIMTASRSQSAVLIRAAFNSQFRSEVILIKGTVSVNGAGTFIPQYILSAAPGGAFTTQIGSYMKIKPIGAAGANINVGGFA